MKILKSFFSASILITLLFSLYSPLSIALDFNKAQPYDALPSQYQKAFKVSASFKGSNLEIFLETFQGYAVYQETLNFSAEGYELQVIEGTEAQKSLDPISQKLKFFYQGQTSFMLQTKALSEKPPNLKIITAHLQACSKENCLLPVKVEISLEDNSNSLSSSKQESPSASSAEGFLSFLSGEKGLTQKIKKKLQSQENLLSFEVLLILFLAGLITAFTPCVLPLFPITLGIFGRWAHHNKGIGFLLTISYGAGIVICYAVHGLFAAASGSLFGSLAQNPTYLISLGLIIFISGLMFSGLIPFPFANQLLKLANSTPENGTPKKLSTLLGRSFIMGATLGLVASPCAGPILVALLAWLSHSLPKGDTQSYLAGFTALSFFGIGMAAPFLVLGHFYFRFHKRLQFGRFSMLSKYMGSALLIGGSLFFLVPGFKLLFNSADTQKTARHENLNTNFVTYNWDNKPANRPLIIDFRADWCEACLEIEKNIFHNPDIQAYMEKNAWALVQVDMTQADAHTDLATKYNVLSLPTVVFQSAKGSVCSSDLTLNSVESVEDFKHRLERAERECF